MIPLRHPTALDDLSILAATVLQEAAAESFLGQLAVAYVVLNRCEARSLSVLDVALEPKQFSAWNTESPTRRRLDTATPAEWRAAYKAAAAAYFDLREDPTRGAQHYLNPAAVLASGSPLPAWAADPEDPRRVDPVKITFAAGSHVFLVLR